MGGSNRLALRVFGDPYSDLGLYGSYYRRFKNREGKPREYFLSYPCRIMFVCGHIILGKLAASARKILFLVWNRQYLRGNLFYNTWKRGDLLRGLVNAL
jgi:hypothetical protein